VAEGFSPHSGGTVPDSHRVPRPLAGCCSEPSIALVEAKRAVNGRGALAEVPAFPLGLLAYRRATR